MARPIGSALGAALFLVCFASVSSAGPASAAQGRYESATPDYRVRGIQNSAQVGYYRRDLAHRGLAPLGTEIPPGTIVMPGYVYLPDYGILDEACNLPTSACSNLYRDAR